MAASVAARIVPNATRFSVPRRIVAGVAGLITLVVVGRCLPFLGLNADALSHSPSPWAVVEEALSMLIGYGSMLAAASAALGRPNVASEAPEP